MNNAIEWAMRPYDYRRHPACKDALLAVERWLRQAFYSYKLHQAEGRMEGGALVLWASDKKGTGFGNGKTMLARLAAVALNRIIPSFGFEFTGDDKLIERIRDSFKADGPHAILKDLRRMAALIIDDFGTAYVKEGSEAWYQEQYYKILNFSYDAKQPLLLTTNLTPDEVAARLGGKNFSRLDGLVGGKAGWVNMSTIPDQRISK